MISMRSHGSSRRFANYRHSVGMWVWVAVGMSSYGALWAAMIYYDDGQSFTAVAKEYQAREEWNRKRQQQAAQEQAAAEERKRQEEQKMSRQEDHLHKRSEKEVFDWTFWGLVVCFCIMAYVRIRSEPAIRRNQRRTLAQMALDDEGNAVQTLRRINRERQGRGERPISLEAYRTLRMVLLQDGMLLQGLAGRTVPPPQRGATPEQLELCVDHTIGVGEDYEGECCICLAPFEANDQVRILPCRHSYHKGCIDHWFEQSILCPICKHSLDVGGV